MIENILQKAYLEHAGKVTDKWSLYLREYDRLFSEVREQPVRFLEIGIQNGGSLEIWADYFSRAERIVGCDINPECHQLTFDDARIAVVIGDVNDEATGQDIRSHSPEYDIIIDDGSHRSSDIIKTFIRYFSHLAKGGLYVIEDLHCSYWQEFEGGLFAPYSSITFFKKLVDIVNYEHWGVDKSAGDFLREICRHYGVVFDERVLSHIHSIEFINSMCVVRKHAPALNELGGRVVAGQMALVDEEAITKFSDQVKAARPDQSSNFWSSRQRAPEEELVDLLAAVELSLKKDQRVEELGRDLAQGRMQIQQLMQTISAHEEKIATCDIQLKDFERLQAEKEALLSSIISSISWKVTCPFRWLATQLRLVYSTVQQTLSGKK